MKKYTFLLAGTLLMTGFFHERVPHHATGLQHQSGKALYSTYCKACHMADGKGIESIFPPLAQSDYLTANPERAIYQVLFGARGTMVVNGVTYDGEMPPQNLTDEEVVTVMNFILNSWGNQIDNITLQQVKKVRAIGK